MNESTKKMNLNYEFLFANPFWKCLVPELKDEDKKYFKKEFITSFQSFIRMQLLLEIYFIYFRFGVFCTGFLPSGYAFLGIIEQIIL
jgi:hypothetical protein